MSVNSVTANVQDFDGIIRLNNIAGLTQLGLS